MKAPLPFYCGDYLRDTVGLTNAQHGAYLLSIIKYWNKGEALTAHEIRESCGRQSGRVIKFYVLDGGKYHHKRIDCELAKAAANEKAAYAKAVAAAKARWKKP
jgi:uncharacterized protein YdaU (DUF1376 family)